MSESMKGTHNGGKIPKTEDIVSVNACAVSLRQLKRRVCHLNDEELEEMLIGLYQLTDQGGCHERFFDAVKEIRDMSYSIGYRHGYEDKANGL